MSGPRPALQWFIAGVPTAQGNHRISRAGRVYEATKGHRAWRNAVAVSTMTHRRRWVVAAWPIAAPVEVRAVFYLPRPSRPRAVAPSGDIDKLARPLLDGIVEGGALVNDRQVVVLHASKRYVGEAEPSGCLVTVLVHRAEKG